VEKMSKDVELVTKIINAAQIATNVGVVPGILLLAIGVGIELLAGKKSHPV